MKRKTSDLTGALLDAAVAKAEGLEPRDYEFGTCWYAPGGGRGLVPYQPSTDWSVGGPIIDQIKPSLGWDDVAERFEAGLEHEARADGCQRSYATGPTYLIAAMRAFVASKLGDEVDL